MTLKLAIIGAGPAGYSAALYTSRAMLAPTMFAGPEPGGQLMFTSEVDNYPGYSEGIVGPQLMDEMRKQAVKFGTELKFETVSLLDTTKRPFTITTESGQYQAESVILAMGARSKMLGLGEEKFLGKGLSTCAVCDAAFFKDKVTYVVGGGDAAVEEVRALSKHAKEVTMIVRKKALRASKIMQKWVTDNSDKVKILWNSEVREVKGDEKLTSIVVENTSDKSKQEILLGGLFLAIGHIPSTGFLKSSGVAIDKKGFIITGHGLSKTGVALAYSRLVDGVVQYPSMTSVEGVFAAGDVVDFRYKQAVTAAGMGVVAALDAEWWLESKSSSE